MKVVIAGSGNVATVLGKVINNAGHEIVQVLSRNEDHAKTLAQVFNCSFGNFKVEYKEADLYLFALSDAALYHLEERDQLKNKLLVHTAGSVSKDVLKNMSANYGVIYPLQSLVKNSDEFPETPLLIDGSSSETITSISDFSKTISKNVTLANDEERLKFHVAAVFVNNFTNHLFALADEFCKDENIDFKKLYPLIEETIKRVKLLPPKSVQTGPALREDIHTLEKHLQILSTHSHLKDLYVKLSGSISKFHKKNS